MSQGTQGHIGAILLSRLRLGFLFRPLGGMEVMSDLGHLGSAWRVDIGGTRGWAGA